MKQLGQCPIISDILTETLGSKKAAIAALRFSDANCAIAFLKKYDSISQFDLELIPLEAVAISAGVGLGELLGATLMAFKSVQAQRSALIAMDKHPGIVEKTAEYAKLPGGDRWARMMHEAVGFLPTPRGQTLNFNLGGPQTATAAPQERTGGDEETQFDDLFPPVNDNLEEWNKDRKKLLAEHN
jgi:hypothetical protein